MVAGHDIAHPNRIGGEDGIRLGALGPARPDRILEEWSLTGEASVLTAGPEGPTRGPRAPYRSRLVVDRPRGAPRSDVVVVEWLNVTVGSDHAFDRVRTHLEMARTDLSWVGVTAQAAGIEAGTGSFGRPSEGLAAQDPDRYGSLHHPGDRFAHDIFAQAVAAVRRHPEITGGPVRTVLAMGHSQSASLLARHLVDVEPWSGLVDGYLIHGRGADAPALHGGAPPLIRADAPITLLPPTGRTPALQVLAETDVVALGAHRARQPDDEAVLTWEVAGGAHVDTHLLRGMDDLGDLDREELAEMWEPSTTCFGQRLDRPMNSGPQHHVLAAALRALRLWVVDGRRPASAPRLRLDPRGRPLTDADGNALGGLRTPAVDAGVLRHRGIGNSGPAVAYLCGVTEPIAERPPIELAEARERTEESLRAALGRGHVLPDDADELRALTEIEHEHDRAQRGSDR